MSQPLLDLFKVRSANDAAAADTKAMRKQGSKKKPKNKIALRVHPLYYKMLILQTKRRGCASIIMKANRRSAQRTRRTSEVWGDARTGIDRGARTGSRREARDADDGFATRHRCVTQLNDAIGLPLTTRLVLDSNVEKVRDICEREECLRVALDSHPEIHEARAEVEKATAGVRG